MQINEVIVLLELKFVIKNDERRGEFLAFDNHDVKVTFAERVSGWHYSEKTEDVGVFKVQRL